MNPKTKLLALSVMAMALSSGAGCNDYREPMSKKPAKTWKLKKCKSCKSYPCNDSRHKWKSNPLAGACENYIKRTK